MLVKGVAMSQSRVACDPKGKVVNEVWWYVPPLDYVKLNLDGSKLSLILHLVLLSVIIGGRFS